jgi:hypothetical protein
MFPRPVYSGIGLLDCEATQSYLLLLIFRGKCWIHIRCRSYEKLASTDKLHGIKTERSSTQMLKRV